MAPPHHWLICLSNVGMTIAAEVSNRLSIAMFSLALFNSAKLINLSRFTKFFHDFFPCFPSFFLFLNFKLYLPLFLLPRPSLPSKKSLPKQETQPFIFSLVVIFASYAAVSLWRRDWAMEGVTSSCSFFKKRLLLLLLLFLFLFSSSRRSLFIIIILIILIILIYIYTYIYFCIFANCLIISTLTFFKRVCK